ncbi:PEP-CTERM sorting domain-containing protein [Thalassotalea euphylliae]|uniref:PEP-CTERM sorting domain-containing protein n=1 Tax=Thalassotalea euphylliae TaxID=1655234 RepID=A0A3E0UCA3_9GAMM|nr:PEP-CTERM sorting domain-containing protein [Thalassotalea euphylliae]REL34207.1 PEP-CTERM sorting domain-containing protein [Thalassotalea euphylliae]
MTSNTSLKVVNKKGNALKLSSFRLASFKLGLGIMLSIASLVSPTSSAGLISDYSLDSDSNIVTDSGNNLEWLQWSVTDGMSIDQALSTYANDGWQLASGAQMAELFNGFELSYGEFDWQDGKSESYESGADGDLESADDRELILISLFGDTLNRSGWQSSGALFGDENSDIFGWASIYDDWYIPEPGPFPIPSPYNPGSSSLFFDNRPNSIVRNGLGVALVRSTESTAVPEPAPLVLVAFGLMALVCTRRAKPLS